MKKWLIMALCLACLLLCACASQTVIDGINVKAEPVEWKYDNSKEVMKAVAQEIGDESDAWNELYYPGATVRQTDESNILLFDNSRIAVLKSDKEPGKIIDTKAYYPDQFGSYEKQVMLSKTAYFDISQNGRFTLLCCGTEGQPLYLFDNEKSTATKITLNESKRAFFIDNSLYVCVAPTSAGFVTEYTTSFLYDPLSGKIEKTDFTEQEDRVDPPDLSGYTDLGSLSSQIKASKWDGSFCKDAITELNNTNPYEVILYLYNLTDKTYCSGKISLQDLML